MDSHQHWTRSSLSYLVFRSWYCNHLVTYNLLLMHFRDNLRFPMYFDENTVNQPLFDSFRRQSYGKYFKMLYILALCTFPYFSNDVLTCGILSYHNN